MKRVITVVFESLLFLIVFAIIIFASWVAYINSRVDTIENQTITNVPGQIITVNDYDIHVQIFGDVSTGTPILLLHQFDPAGSLSLQDFALELSNTHPVIVPDLLGFGFSERVAESGEHYTPAGRVELLAGLLDSLNVSQVDVIGHDYGGAIAVQFALDNPQRVAHLALISADIYEDDFDFIETVSALPGGIGRAITFVLEGGGSAGKSSEEADCINCQVNPRNQYVLIADTTNALMAMASTEQESQVADYVSALTMPVAVIWGNDDFVIPLDNGQRLAEETGAEELLIIPDGGHYPFEVDMNSIIDMLERFLSG